MESEAFLLGIWKNFDELEESISVPELNAILDASRKRVHEDRRFAAGLKGIKLPDHKEESAEEKVERAKRRAAAKLAGVSEEEFEMGDLGFGVEYEEEE